jgi:uracil-DNA glycosylase
MRVITLAHQTDFAGWRAAARKLIVDDIAPEDASWIIGTQDSLFLPTDENEIASDAPSTFTAPRTFLQRAAAATLHRDGDRFAFLYRVLWRLRREPGLIEIAVDSDIVRLDAMVKAIRRDLHKMKADVRFREIAVPTATGGRARPSQVERALRDGDHFGVLEPWFVAWFEPSHHIVEAVAPFLTHRFTTMHWAILTPDRSASWNGKDLSFGPGAQRSDASDGDVLEDLWRTCYANIFNPARHATQCRDATANRHRDPLRHAAP